MHTVTENLQKQFTAGSNEGSSLSPGKSQDEQVEELRTRALEIIKEINDLLEKNDEVVVTLAKPEAADIFILMDRSGSMSTRLTDAQGGYDTFIKEQAKVPDTNVCLWDFDTEHRLVYSLKPASKIPVGDEKDAYKIVPRGSTALLDAMMRIIAYAEEHQTDGRKTIVVFQTDGLENMSRESTRSQVSKRIADKREQGWEFIYLGANQDAIAEARSFGIAESSAATYDVNCSPVAFAGVASMVTKGRKGESYAFSDDARKTFRSN